MMVFIRVKSCFVSMLLFPFSLSPCVDTSRHKQDTTRGGDVTCTSPSRTSSESREVGSRVSASVDTMVACVTGTDVTPVMCHSCVRLPYTV